MRKEQGKNLPYEDRPIPTDVDIVDVLLDAKECSPNVNKHIGLDVSPNSSLWRAFYAFAVTWELSTEEALEFLLRRWLKRYLDNDWALVPVTVCKCGARRQWRLTDNQKSIYGGFTCKKCGEHRPWHEVRRIPEKLKGKIYLDRKGYVKRKEPSKRRSKAKQQA